MNSIINIERMKGGDLFAFKDFFECFYPKLMALACRFVDEQVAKDLVQEVFITYWEQMQTIEVENIHSFLFKCIQNSCLNYIKHQMVVGEFQSRVRIAEARIASLGETTDNNEILKELMNRDLREMIELSVSKLPKKCAQVFRLCYFEDISRKEVADMLGISCRTVEGHIRQAMIFLRKDLRELFVLVLIFHIGG